MIWLYILAVLLAVFMIAFALAACRISGECSRIEEAEEAEERVKYENAI